MSKNTWFSLLTITCLILIGLQSPEPALAQPNAQATIAQTIFILSPREGQPPQGVEIIEGKIRGDGFTRGKIAFSYAGVENPSWFYIADIEPEAADSSQASFQAEWDTSQITDGNYHLRVVAEYQNAAVIFEVIPNLRIRNYSQVETSTPQPVVEDPGTTAIETATSEPLPENTPTSLPLNPVVIKSEGLSRVLLGSGIVVILAFAAGGLYWFIKYRVDD